MEENKRPTKLVHDCSTNETVELELTDEEILELEEFRRQYAEFEVARQAAEAEVEAKRQAAEAQKQADLEAIKEKAETDPAFKALVRVLLGEQ